MIYNLFLDDIRIPDDVLAYTNNLIYIQIPWKIVRNYEDFIKAIKEDGIPYVISFDHDLADIHYNHQQNINYDNFSEKTGYHCAKWLIDYCIDNNKELPSEIIIHSMNPYGSLNIKSLFETYFRVHEIEHAPIKLNPYLRLSSTR